MPGQIIFHKYNTIGSHFSSKIEGGGEAAKKKAWLPEAILHCAMRKLCLLQLANHTKGSFTEETPTCRGQGRGVATKYLHKASL